MRLLFVGDVWNYSNNVIILKGVVLGVNKLRIVERIKKWLMNYNDIIELLS